MTTIQREKQLLQAMEVKGYTPLFDSQEEALDTIGRSLKALLDYQNSVIQMEFTQPILYARYEGEELRDKVMALDAKRRSKHESAITNCNLLNRICDRYEVERIVPIDTSDRHQVAEFIGNFCYETFDAGLYRTPQEAFTKRAERRTLYEAPLSGAAICETLKEIEDLAKEKPLEQ